MYYPNLIEAILDATCNVRTTEWLIEHTHDVPHTVFSAACDYLVACMDSSETVRSSYPHARYARLRELRSAHACCVVSEDKPPTV